MKIKAGYEISYDCLEPTPMILTLDVHPTRRHDLLTPDRMLAQPVVPTTEYCDGFGNICHVIRAPPCQLTISADFLIEDSGEADEVAPEAARHLLEALPVETLVYLLGSRYCDTQTLSDFAWRTFGATTPGWDRVHAICDFVHNQIRFDYSSARDDRTASGAFRERLGVCRDFTHLAITLCRCMNIPARYCTGYLGDIGVEPDPAPMDFSAWFEVFLAGRWFAFDARHNHPRIGRILIARTRRNRCRHHHVVWSAPTPRFQGRYGRGGGGRGPPIV